MSDIPHTDPVDIFMWRRIDDRLTTSGQPSEAQLEQISKLGITHVVNLGLHSHEKALPDEAGTVKQLGMTYIHLPVDFDNPTGADYARFRDVMRELDAHVVHVHCIANLRVSAFLYRYHCDDIAMPEPAARQKMESVWRPGGVWARFIGRNEQSDLPHRFAGRDY